MSIEIDPADKMNRKESDNGLAQTCNIVIRVKIEYEPLSSGYQIENKGNVCPVTKSRQNHVTISNGISEISNLNALVIK